MQLTDAITHKQNTMETPGISASNISCISLWIRVLSQQYSQFQSQERRITQKNI